MKKFVLGMLLLSSLGVKAQSYFILNNGITLTLDKEGFIYDFGNFFLPYQVQVNGGQFLISDNKLHTIDDKGFLYKKEFEVDEVKGKGLNYFINDDYHLVTIDSKGFYYKFDKEKSVFKKAAGFGGNYFTVLIDKKKKKTDLYTVSSNGTYFKMNVTNLDPHTITTFGGKWFLTNKNVLFSVSSDGKVFEKPEVKIGKVVKAGGNFIVDDQNKIYTISEEGFVFLPSLPMKMNLNSLTKFGANYLLDKEGNAFVVDSKGNVSQRNLEDHDLRNVKILSNR